MYVVVWWRGGEGEKSSQATDAKETAFSPKNLVIAHQTPPVEMPSSVPSHSKWRWDRGRVMAWMFDRPSLNLI